MLSCECKKKDNKQNIMRLMKQVAKLNIDCFINACHTPKK